MKTNFFERSDSQWEVIEKIRDDQRKCKHSLRSIINVIFWINDTGSQWRNLESKYQLCDGCTVGEAYQRVSLAQTE